MISLISILLNAAMMQMQRAFEMPEVIVHAENVKKSSVQAAMLIYTEWLKEKVPGLLRLVKGDKSVEREIVALVLNNRGHLKYLLVDFDGAANDYNEGLKYNPLLSSLYYNRGYFDRAAQDMLVATKLSPECTEFQIAFQRTLDQLNRVQ